MTKKEYSEAGNLINLQCNHKVRKIFLRVFLCLIACLVIGRYTPVPNGILTAVFIGFFIYSVILFYKITDETDALIKILDEYDSGNESLVSFYENRLAKHFLQGYFLEKEEK